MNAKKSISHIFSVLFIIVLLLSVTPLHTAHAAGVRFAKPSATGTGDCSSWDNACTLQTALTGALSGNEIWVAAGTYKPTTGSDRTATFQLIDGVALYGGFAGTETSRNQRDPASNVAILSGDIDNNDSQTPIITNLKTVTGNTTNSYHVVTGATSATLDSFTITAGYAYSTSWDCPGAACGGGMNNESSNPILTNVTFTGNKSTSDGGGMYNQGSAPTLTNVTFSGNSSGWNGGGMLNSNSNPTLTNVTFNGNTARNDGGGMENNFSNPTLTNVTFSGNTAQYRGGGMINWYSGSVLTNVTFNSNSATDDGGGIENINSILQIRNTILWGNTASSGAQIDNGSSTSSVSDSIVQGGYAGGTNIITTDPLLGPLGNYGGFTQTIPLLPGSSAIDTGDDGICPATDQRGVTRPQGAHCDIGAFEVRIYYSIYLPLILR